jgi:hypothetical protein
MGLVYEQKKELQQALNYLQKALAQYQLIMSVMHHDIISNEKDIQRLRAKLEFHQPD